jgi:hypothetical protein
MIDVSLRFIPLPTHNPPTSREKLAQRQEVLGRWKREQRHRLNQGIDSRCFCQFYGVGESHRIHVLETWFSKSHVDNIWRWRFGEVIRIR